MKLLQIIIVLLLSQQGLSQHNALIFEFGGNAQGGSLNYERALSSTPGLTFSLGLGFALVEEDQKDADVEFDLNLPGIPDPKLSIPFSFQYHFHINNQDYLEAGLGYTWINIDKTFESGERGSHNFILSTGYRKYFGSEKNWLWKVNFSPIIAGNRDSGIGFGFSPMVGIAIGKRF